MAIKQTIIKAVRVWNTDGTAVELPWDPSTWYLIGDDRPFLEILTQGHPAAFKDRKRKLETKLCEDGKRWQRWDLSEELSRSRRLGEVSAALKVPKDCILCCYVIPRKLLDVSDVLTMVEDVETELGVSVAWDVSSDSLDNGRSWSHPSTKSSSMLPAKMLDDIETEISAAASIRRNPFLELGPLSRRGIPLPENALVSQWAMCRSSQLRYLSDAFIKDLKVVKSQGDMKNPDGRQARIQEEIARLKKLKDRSIDLSARVSQYVDDLEIGTPIQLSPLFQRDYRLRYLLRAFAPSPSEAIGASQSVRSSYPPITLNHLWEMWGIVWIVKQLRALGFSGKCFLGMITSVNRFSWHLEKGGVTIKLDFEAEPAFVDYEHMPPIHERAVPALEWAARHQKVNVDRPFLGAEEKCSPDYLIRIITSTTRVLVVGDAALATPCHHKKKIKQTKTKPQIVERYRRTIGWVDGDQIVRCHPMGGFVVFPAPAREWSELETISQARDCMLLCPGPLDDAEASKRLTALLESIVPEIGFSSNVAL